MRGGLLDVFPATEDRAVRVDMFDVEIESLRWFSTFTQRSLGEVEEVEIAPAAELAAEHRELAELAAEELAPARDGEAAERPDIAELLPVERFGALLDLIGGRHRADRRRRGGARARARATTGTTSARRSATTDAHHLYVSPEQITATLDERARTWLSAHASDQQIELRAQAADTAARSLAEAEPELEQLVRSGYRTVVAFPRRGEGERAAYNLGRLKASWLGEDVDVAPPGPRALAALRRRLAARGLRRAAAEARRLPRAPAAAPPAPAGRRRRGRRPARGDGARCARSPSCAPATSSCTRTTASRASPASRRARSRTSRATTCTSNTRATTACYVPTDQLAKISRYVGTAARDGASAAVASSAARAGRR